MWKQKHLKESTFEKPYESWRGTELDKGEGINWILVIGLVIFAVAIFFIYAVP